jgi:integrase
LYIEICKAAGVREKTLNASFCSLPESTRKNRLNGWLLLQQFCAKHKVDTAAFETDKNPALLFADMLVEMRESGIKDHLRETVRPALQQILDIVGRNIKIVDNSFASSLFRTTSTTVKKGPRFVTIWKLEPFLQYIASLFPPDNLPWHRLMGIAGAIFLVFVPCRTIALIRIDPTTAVADNEEDSLSVITKEKTDRGGTQSRIWIRNMHLKAISPRYYWNVLVRRGKRLKCPNALFVSDAGKPYMRSDSIAKAMRDIMTEAGIPNKYNPYTIRHAMINALINAGLDEKQVNAYTGHSYNYHTAFKYYYHLDPNWAGSKLAPVSEKAAKLIEADGVGEEEL